MLKTFALIFIGACLAAASAAAQGKPTKPEDCEKLDGAKRSECAQALGQTKDNLRSNKSGETRAGERGRRGQGAEQGRQADGSVPAKEKTRNPERGEGSL